MNVDTNTRGHQQWFYFRVRNIQKDTQYKFSIWNFTKPQSLYKNGMKLMWKSKKKQKVLNLTDDIAWEFIPDENISDIRYMKSKLVRPKRDKSQFKRLFLEEDVQQVQKQVADNASYHCLSFTLTFQYPNDSVCISYSRPFKYTTTIINLLQIEHSLMSRNEKMYVNEINANVKFDRKSEVIVPNLFIYTR